MISRATSEKILTDLSMVRAFSTSMVRATVLRDLANFLICLLVVCRFSMSSMSALIRFRLALTSFWRDWISAMDSFRIFRPFSRKPPLASDPIRLTVPSINSVNSVTLA